MTSRTRVRIAARASAAAALLAVLAGCAAGPAGGPPAPRRTAPGVPAHHPAAVSCPDWEPPRRAPAAAPAWYRVESGTRQHLLGVHFAAPLAGWAVGRGGTVLATADGGRTWKRQESGLAKADLYAVFFLDAKRGWACGGPGDGPPARGHILMGGDLSAAATLRTADGGASWEKVWAPTNFTLTALHMLDGKRGVIASHGGAAHPDGDTVTTTDGGGSWATRRIFRALHALCFVDTKTGFAAGTGVRVGFMPQPTDPLYVQGGARLARTVDGGATWKPLKHPELDRRDEFFGVSFADAKAGWACGSRGTIFATADGGDSWTKQASGTEQALRDVFALSAKEAWAVGAGGTVLHTVDGGARWTRLPCPEGVALRRVWFTSAEHGVAVGLEGTALLWTREGGGLTPLEVPAPPPAPAKP